MKTLGKMGSLLCTIWAISGCVDEKLRNGHWLAEGYGSYIEITYDKKSKTYVSEEYRYVGEYCLLIATESYSGKAFKQSFKQDGNINKLTLVEEGQELTPGLVYLREDTKPTQCETPLVLSHESSHEFNPTQDFDYFWQFYNHHYVDFTLTNTDWRGMYDEYLVQAIEAENEFDLFDIFAEMITPLGDAHNVIGAGVPLEANLFDSNYDDMEMVSYSSKKDYVEALFIEYFDQHPYEEGDDMELVEAQSIEYVEDQIFAIHNNIESYAADENGISTAADDSLVWFKTDDNLGYIFLDSMDEYGDESSLVEDKLIIGDALDKILNEFSDTDGIIFDVRMNSGGSDEISAFIAGHFTDNKYHAYSKQARYGDAVTPLIDVSILPASGRRYVNPIVILASESTASAAEIFLLAMKPLEQVTIIGESSAGALSDILVNRVTSDVMFTLSNEIYLDSEGNWFERKGIPVDVAVPFLNKQQRDQGIDSGIEKAREILMNK